MVVRFLPKRTQFSDAPKATAIRLLSRVTIYTGGIGACSPCKDIGCTVRQLEFVRRTHYSIIAACTRERRIRQNACIATLGGNAVVGSQDTRASVWGITVGADYKVSPNTLLGFALAGGATGFSLANGLGSGSADVFQAGAYARHNFGPAYVAAALGYGWHDVTTNRTVALTGIDLLQGRFRADTFSGRFEGGYRFATPMIGITPYAAMQAISFNLPAYAEQTLAGTGLFALNYAAQTTTDTRTELGLRGDKSFAMQNAVITLRGRAAWAHDYNPDRAVTAIFQALPGANFVVNGARPDANSAIVSAGAEMKWPNGFSLAATFEGEFSGNVTSYAGKGVVRYNW